MIKVHISVVGRDRPGIVAAVSKILFRTRSNIENISQTIQQGHFAAIFIATLPPSLSQQKLLSQLENTLDPLGLDVLLRAVDPENHSQLPAEKAIPFVITTVGRDRIGLVAGITEILARFNINITNLRAAFHGGEDPNRNTMIYEVDIPENIDQKAFRKALKGRAKRFGLDLNLQHREIFEAIHRV
ncbi:MAG: amino acid-binding protein [Deltaproteobacteria bacterium]|nr:amino acid-binding protein [Deltaproteobacteria bacterium]